MIKNLILILVIYFVYRTIKNMMIQSDGQGSDGPLGQTGEDKGDVMTKDPHCGVYFPKRDAFTLNAKGETLYFCSEKCRDDYKKKM
jgi:uncharacterized protein